jgi:hypothetical protein
MRSRRFLQRALGVTVVTVFASLTWTAAFAASYPPPAPSPADRATVWGSSSTGGAKTYAYIYDTDAYGYVCDTKADGHHAYGEIQVSVNGGAWTTVASGSEYDGNATCTEITMNFDYRTGLSARVRTESWTKEGSATIGSPGFSPVWSGSL